jgi:oligosaccharide repeat unit polymerase
MHHIYFILLIFVFLLVIKFSNLKINGFFYPPAFFSYLIFLGFILPYPIVISLEYNSPFFMVWGYTYVDFQQGIQNSLIAAILSLTFFFIGFKFAVAPKERSKIQKITFFKYYPILNKNYFFFFTLTLFFLCVILLVIRIIQVGGVSNYFAGNENRVKFFEGNNIFGLIQNCFAGVFLFWYFINLKTSSFFSKFIFFFCAAILLLSGNSKSPLFVLLVSMFITYYYFKNRISIIKIILSSLFFMFFFVVWEIVFREYFVIGELANYDTSISLAQNFWIRFADFFIGNFMQLQTVSIVIDHYQAGDQFLYGSSFLMILLIALPRAIFPWKPLTAAGDFTIALWPEKFEYNGTTLPPGLIGELYMNFSWAGIIVGIYIIGLIYGLLWKKFKNDQNDVTYSILFSIALSLLLHIFRGELSSPILLGFFFFIPSIILKNFTRMTK